MTRLVRIADTEKTPAKICTVEFGVYSTKVKIFLNFTEDDDEARINARFIVKSRQGVQRKFFHVSPPCVLYAEGTNSGVSLVEVNSVEVSEDTS